MSFDQNALDSLRSNAAPSRPTQAREAVYKWFLASVLVIAAIAARLCAACAIAPIEVETATAVASACSAAAEPAVLNASGYVVARRQATVSSKVTGKVDEVLIEEGMEVKEGQLLARLDEMHHPADVCAGATTARGGA